MDIKDVIRQKIELTARDCQSVSQSLAIIDPFIAFTDIETINSAYTKVTIVGVITDKICRYAVISMGRIWDDRKGVACLKNIMKLLKKDASYDQKAKHIYNQFELLTNDSIVGRVRKFRHDYLAHTSGSPQSEASTFTPIELIGLHQKTCKLVDDLYELVNDRPAGLGQGYSVWCGDSLGDWMTLLTR